MATYKVLQDIEAEDKLFGPFTLKQFIFGAIAAVLIFIGFRILITPLPTPIKVVVVLVLLPPLLVFGFLAAPIGQDQPNDVWLFARLRFLFKPRTRIWNQDGVNNLVTVTAPKKQETVFVKNLNQDEVRSRLQALANTVDSRGWAVKNVNTNLFAQPGYLTNQNTSDRLVDPSEFPQEVSNVDVQATDDMLDPRSNATAQHLDQLIKKSSSQHKQQVRDQAAGKSAPTQTPQDYYFMNQPQTPQMTLPQDYATFSNQQVVAPGANDTVKVDESEEEKAFAHKLIEEKEREKGHVSDHMRVLQPLHDEEGKPLPAPRSEAVQTEETPTEPQQKAFNPAVASLSSNNDLDVATIARQAKKMNEPDDDDEVVISLH